LFNYDVGDASLKNEHRDFLIANVVPVMCKAARPRRHWRHRQSLGIGPVQSTVVRATGRAHQVVSEQQGVFADQIADRRVGEARRRRRQIDGTETDEDRAVLVQVDPPAPLTPSSSGIDPTKTEDGFDPCGPTISDGAGVRRPPLPQPAAGESLRLRSTNPAAVMLVDPATNRLYG